MKTNSSENNIRVYIADYIKLGLNDTWENLFEHLPYDDRERIGRFKIEADRIRGTVGTLLIRSMAERVFPDEEIVIGRTEMGKPYLYGKEGYEFSLSHSGDMIVLAVGRLPVGVDVEIVKEKDWRMFHRFLSKEEMKMIEGDKDPEIRFFEVWTVREAFSKEEGQGLRILDDVFKVDYDRKKISYKDKILNFDHM
nr:4'-phosphopantetheinyl transferase superfamily protein [Lachnospiraceae bacterium]